MDVIVIDPGHGGDVTVGGSSPNNATGPAGTPEKQLTLAIGLRLKDHLVAAGHRVLMTREQDVNLGLADRAHVARDNQAAVFISIHLNGDADSSIDGSETWLNTRHSARSESLADAVQPSLVGATGCRDRGVKSKNLGVLNPDFHDSGTACCLVEVSFLTHPEEEARLLSADYQDRVATALAGGIKTYFDLPIAKAPVAVAASFEEDAALANARPRQERKQRYGLRRRVLLRRRLLFTADF